MKRVRKNTARPGRGALYFTAYFLLFEDLAAFLVLGFIYFSLRIAFAQDFERFAATAAPVPPLPVAQMTHRADEEHNEEDDPEDRESGFDPAVTVAVRHRVTVSVIPSHHKH